MITKNIAVWCLKKIIVYNLENIWYEKKLFLIKKNYLHISRLF